MIFRCAGERAPRSWSLLPRLRLSGNKRSDDLFEVGNEAVPSGRGFPMGSFLQMGRDRVGREHSTLARQ